MIKLVALDMDGTTLNNDGYISDVNREMINLAMAKGIHIAIASGRAYSSLPGDVLSIPGIEYAIASNGANIYRTTDNECIMRHLLSSTSVESILSLVNSHKTEGLLLTYEAFIDGTPYTDSAYYDDPRKFGATKWAVNYIHNTRTPVGDIIPFIREHIDKLDCIDIVASDSNWTKGFIQILKDTIADIYVTSSVHNLIEISNTNSGKGKALKHLANYLNIDIQDTCGIGDQDNDLELITTAGYGVAMGNATDTVKAAADFVTKSNNEDGVAFALKKIMDET